MSFTRTEAIVIKAINLREADKIITFFSKDYGKIQGIAKGIRKIHTKYSGKLELFTRVNVIFFQKTEPLHSGGFPEKHPLLRITQADTVEMFPQLTTDFHKIIGASYIAEFLNKVFEEYDTTHTSAYVLVCNALRALANAQNIRNILPAFEVNLLAQLGYAPVLDSCTNCQRVRTKTLDTESDMLSTSPENLLGFNFSTGGVLCQNCKRLKKGTLDVHPQTINLLQQFLDTPIMKVEQISCHSQFHQEMKIILRGHIQYHLGIALKTDTFVQKLRTTHFPK